MFPQLQEEVNSNFCLYQEGFGYRLGQIRKNNIYSCDEGEVKLICNLKNTDKYKFFRETTMLVTEEILSQGQQIFLKGQLYNVIEVMSFNDENKTNQYLIGQ